MSDYQMGEIEARFADLIWENAPISSTELSKKAEEALTWKKSTSYTVLRRLCEKGLFRNENGTVTPVLSREEYFSAKSASFVDETFSGSLPAFLAAFSKRRKLTKEEISEIRQMIDGYHEE